MELDVALPHNALLWSVGGEKKLSGEDEVMGRVAACYCGGDVIKMTFLF